MKKIFGYLLDYYHEQNKWHFLAVTLFTAIAIYLNDRFDIENTLIDSHYGTFKHFYLYFLLYASATVPVYLSYVYDKESRKRFVFNPAFWISLLISLGIFSFYCYFYQYRDWIGQKVDGYYMLVFVRTCADQIVQSSLMFLMVLVFWMIRDRKHQPLYGFSLENVEMKPYLWMLAAMTPLIIGAGFFSSFTEYYPTARKIMLFKEHLEPNWLYVFIYELCYGSEFFHIEFFFRGFMILAFVRYAGSKVILPVAVFYCFVHFGKPLGECISSYFGGIILGILAYRTRSIAAGVLVHLGIAWLMEIVAGVVYLINSMKPLPLN